MLRSAAAGIPRSTYTTARDFTDDEWSACTQALARRGLLDEAGLTAAGRALDAEIERVTDDLAAAAYDALTDAEVDELIDLLAPLAPAVVTAGEIPAAAPMGLRLDDEGR